MAAGTARRTAPPSPTLLALQKDTTPAAVRLGAARAILEIGMKVRDATELEERLTALEQRMAQEKAG